MKTKTIFTITLWMLFIASYSFAQETDTLTVNNDSIEEVEYPVYTLPEIFTTDNNLKLISQFIPENWIITHYGDTLQFRHVSPIYKLSDSLSVDTAKKGRGKFKELPPLKPDSTYIIILLEPLWSGQKVDDAKLKNSHTNAQIAKLLKKYKISHLEEFLISDNFDINSDTLTENERKSIIRYLEDKAKLEQELIRTPHYHTTSFSLFILTIFPSAEDIMNYTPPGIVMETTNIIELFEKYAGK
jgi:hypothetical protein